MNYILSPFAPARDVTPNEATLGPSKLCPWCGLTAHTSTKARRECRADHDGERIETL